MRMSHMKVRSSSEKMVAVAKAYPKPDWQTSVDKSVLLDRYSDFHPAVLAVMKFVLPNIDPLLDLTRKLGKQMI